MLRIAFVVAALAAGVVQAAPTATIVRDLATPAAATRVDTYGSPDVLAGALATAYFSDGSSQQALFATAGFGSLASAGAVGSSFAIGAVAGTDTSRPGEWFVSNLDSTRTLVGFAIDGRGLGAGLAAFDVSSFTSAADTPGSGSGSEMVMDFTGRTFITGNVTTTYSNPVTLNGAAPAGDLFARVQVNLAYTTNSLNAGLPPASLFGGVFSSQDFFSDLDTVVYAPVPEPASALLLLAGAAGLALRKVGRATRRTGRC